MQNSGIFDVPSKKYELKFKAKNISRRLDILQFISNNIVSNAHFLGVLWAIHKLRNNNLDVI